MGRYIFRQAEPVWAARLQKEMNIRMGFYAQVDKCKSSVNLACSTSYQIYVNGNFAAAGPASPSLTVSTIIFRSKYSMESKKIP